MYLIHILEHMVCGRRDFETKYFTMSWALYVSLFLVLDLSSWDTAVT